VFTDGGKIDFERLKGAVDCREKRIAVRTSGHVSATAYRKAVEKVVLRLRP
jgi:hypothetical protein